MYVCSEGDQHMDNTKQTRDMESQNRKTFAGWVLVRLLLEVPQHLPVHTNSLSGFLFRMFSVGRFSAHGASRADSQIRAALTLNGPY